MAKVVICEGFFLLRKRGISFRFQRVYLGSDSSSVPVPGQQAGQWGWAWKISSAALRAGWPANLLLLLTSWSHGETSQQVSLDPKEPQWAPALLPLLPHRLPPNPPSPRPLISGTQLSSWVQICSSSSWWGSCWERWRTQPQGLPLLPQVCHTVVLGLADRCLDPPEGLWHSVLGRHGGRRCLLLWGGWAHLWKQYSFYLEANFLFFSRLFRSTEHLKSKSVYVSSEANGIPLSSTQGGEWAHLK